MNDGMRIGIVGGAGWLGSSIAQAMLDCCMIEPAGLSLSYRSQKPEKIAGAHWTRDNGELAARSDALIISVRPQDWPAISIDAKGKLCISVMAGIGLDQLAARLNTSRVIRSLPNAAAEVGMSYTPWVASPDTTSADRDLVTRMFEACGMTDEVASESELEYLTGLSGSGPAFPALLASAMMDDAMRRGLAPEVARRAVESVLIGTGRLFDKSHEDPRDTVETFVAYRGTTAAAIQTMRAAGFDATVSEGLAAAFRKSVDMGKAEA
jgi:pyrroline-5-carboxylate reductase